MAFLKKIKLDNTGLGEIDAYIRVGLISGTKNRVEFSLDFYASQSAFQEGKDVVKPSESYSFVPDSSETAPNWITQCYEYLCTTDDYRDAVRVDE